MRRVLLLLAPVIVLFLAFRTIADQTISGTVTDANGNGIPNVTVQVKGTKTATTTDVKGQFSISYTNGKAVLVFSAVGFESVEKAVKGQTTLNITLNASQQNLEEVVVTGYGTK